MDVSTENPGSFNEFRTELAGEISDDEALRLYSSALANFHKGVASSTPVEVRQDDIPVLI